MKFYSREISRRMRGSRGISGSFWPPGPAASLWTGILELTGRVWMGRRRLPEVMFRMEVEIKTEKYLPELEIDRIDFIREPGE